VEEVLGDFFKYLIGIIILKFKKEIIIKKILIQRKNNYGKKNKISSKLFL
jgi:hypothetical protein